MSVSPSTEPGAKTVSVVIAKNGLPVIKKNGRYMSSSVDPAKEAQTWAERAMELVHTRSARKTQAPVPAHIFVLGLGAGYHIVALKKICPQSEIVVLENDPLVVSAAESLQPQLQTERIAHIISEPEVRRLIENKKFCEFLNKPYLILKHGPSLQVEPEYFTEVERLLIGRDPLAFLVLLKTRPELYSLLDPEAINRLLGNGGSELVSIKTIQKLFSKSSGFNQERRMWKVLEELVK
jgi:hypothetical protein